MIDEQSFVFNNSQQTLSVFTQQLFSYLYAQLAHRPNRQEVLLRAKFVISELLNNAVKHSGTDETVFKFNFIPNSLIITKHDTGQPWHLLTSSSATHDLPLIISADDVHQLYAVNEGDVVRFYCKEMPVDKAEAENLQEHLGLIIITKAANEFTYKYQEPANIFTAVINLG